MKSLKCPRCGSVFSVDEADYATIVTQVRTAEFDAELSRRMEQYKEAAAAAREADMLKADRAHERQMNQRDREIERLKGEIEQLHQRISGYDTEQRLKLTEAITSREREEARRMAAKDEEIATLRREAAVHKTAVELAVSREKQAAGESIQALDREISRLKFEAEGDRNRAARELEMQRKAYELQLHERDVYIEQLRDMKARLSTKMLGETLEQHCYNSFNSIRAMAFPQAYFDKDNDASDGSKGDFIFRDYDAGQEYISIMFEMKNEMDTTATKHRNEDFLDKLHRDRVAKKCEYAVLVSMLEADNEFYNQGIVDVSYRYDKMYVIRPQFFNAIISLLSRASRKNVQLQRELELARSQSIDVSDFEIKLEGLKQGFNKSVRQALDKHNEAIKGIDNAIKTLQKIKEAFVKSGNYLESADEKLDDITIRRLTYGNPTMRRLFQEARDMRAEAGLEPGSLETSMNDGDDEDSRPE